MVKSNNGTASRASGMSVGEGTGTVGVNAPGSLAMTVSFSGTSAPGAIDLRAVALPASVSQVITDLLDLGVVGTVSVVTPTGTLQADLSVASFGLPPAVNASEATSLEPSGTVLPAEPISIIVPHIEEGDGFNDD